MLVGEPHIDGREGLLVFPVDNCYGTNTGVFIRLSGCNGNPSGLREDIQLLLDRGAFVPGGEQVIFDGLYHESQPDFEVSPYQEEGPGTEFVILWKGGEWSTSAWRKIHWY